MKSEPTMSVGRDSSVGIVTRYGFDGPGSNPGGGRDIPHPFRPSLGSTQPPYGVSFPEVKRPGRDVHPPHVVPRLSKEKRYTCTPPLGLRALF
jgi:hypothetical protein